MRTAKALLTLVAMACSSGFACSIADIPMPHGGDSSEAAPSDPASTETTTSTALPGSDDPGNRQPPVPEPGVDAGYDVLPLDTGPIAATKKIKDLTGSGTSSKQFGVGGTDLGIPFRQPNGKIGFIFGDTFEADGVAGPGWRSPVLLRADPGKGSLAAGITFNGAAGGSYAKQILSYQHDTNGYSTWLPSDAIVIGKRIYLHFVVNQGLGNVQWTQIAYSDDNGENWTVGSAKFDAHDDGDKRQVWTWERGLDGWVYVMSTKFITRDMPLIMYRVPEDKILDKAAYQPWGVKNGTWAWGNPASVILDGKFGELCLRRVENKWVLSWFNSGEYNISIKVFDGPTANLAAAKTYTPIKGTDWGTETSTSVAQLYGGYIHPDSTLHNLHLIVSQWNTSSSNGWPYRAMQFVTGVE